MSANVFYRKWRPQSLAEVVGQEHITQTLLNALTSGRLAHAYVFCGPKGTGKTSTGRILAKALNCENNEGRNEPCNACPTCRSITDGNALDVIEIDAASNRGVDEIRSLTEKVNYAPNSGRFKVYIIDEFHMLTTEASNALLKTLEEPPAHIVFILATTEAHKILPTILSRCQRYDFRKVNLETTISQLQKIAAGENIQTDKETLSLIARASGGSLRDAENLLQQIYTQYGQDISLQNAKEMLGATASDYSLKIVDGILKKDGGSAMLSINDAANHGASPKTLFKDILSTLRLVMLAKNNCLQSAELTKEESAQINEMAKNATLPQVLCAIKLFVASENSAESGMLPLEVATAECAIYEVPTVMAVNPVSKLTNSEKNVSTKEPIKSNSVPREPIKSAPVTKTDSEVNTVGKKTAALGSSDVFDFDNMPNFGGDMLPEKLSKTAAKTTNMPKAKDLETKITAQEPDLQDKINEPKTEEKINENLAKNVAQEESFKGTAGVPHAAHINTEELTVMREKIKEYCKNAPRNLATSTACAILRSHGIVELEDASGNIAYLAFKHKFHMEKISKDRQVKKDAEDIISAALGRDYIVECRLEDSNYLLNEALKIGAKIIREEQN